MEHGTPDRPVGADSLHLCHRLLGLICTYTPMSQQPRHDVAESAGYHSSVTIVKRSTFVPYAESVSAGSFRLSPGGKIKVGYLSDNWSSVGTLRLSSTGGTTRNHLSGHWANRRVISDDLCRWLKRSSCKGAGVWTSQTKDCRMTPPPNIKCPQRCSARYWPSRFDHFDSVFTL
jgi:hypothetical protein